MNPTPKHTPTPWRLHPCNDSKVASLILRSDDSIGEMACLLSVGKATEFKANAAHIVKAVNLHDELVQVLESIIEVNELDGEESVYTEKWKELLKKAKG